MALQENPIRAAAVIGPNDVKLQEWFYEPRSLQPEDVEIRISVAGVCHSDLHEIRQELKPNDQLRPIVPGHEIVGNVIRAGIQAPFAVGDRVAVGTFVGSCGHCEQCQAKDEVYCQEMVPTYTGIHKVTGARLHGGFADRIIVDSKFVFKVPDNLPSTAAAPLMCAGITVYQPLKRHFQKGATVGVVGIGGLGHLALQFARHALEYEKVIAFTTSADKAGSAISKFGAHEVVLLTDKDAMKRAANTIDLLLITSVGDLPWDDYITLLHVGGTMCLLGLPYSGKITMQTKPLIMRRIQVTGSVTGGTAITKEMLDQAALHKIYPVVEEFRLDAEGANDALERVRSNKARFRCVLIAVDEMRV